MVDVLGKWNIYTLQIHPHLDKIANVILQLIWNTIYSEIEIQFTWQVHINKGHGHNIWSEFRIDQNRNIIIKFN